MSPDPFEEIALHAARPGGDWYPAFMEALAEMQRRHPGGFGVIEVGERAWQGLTPVQRAHALPALFTAYYQVIADEEHTKRLDQAAAQGTTYLGGMDEALLNESLIDADLTDPDAQVDGVDAGALHRVLAELDLLQHRLRMATGETDQ